MANRAVVSPLVLMQVTSIGNIGRARPSLADGAWPVRWGHREPCHLRDAGRLYRIRRKQVSTQRWCGRSDPIPSWLEYRGRHSGDESGRRLRVPKLELRSRPEAFEGGEKIPGLPRNGCLQRWITRPLGRLDRENKASAIQSMREIGERVRAHRLSIWILPEGTRSPDGRLQPFKKGSAHLALQTGLPVVPVVVHEEHRFWHNGLTVHPGYVCVELLPPVPTTHWGQDTIDVHLRSIEELFAVRLGAHASARQS